MKETKDGGITLIALVITIIILLILAGVAISSLTENGLFEKVELAKKSQTKSEMKEQLVLAVQELQVEKEGDATIDDITQEWVNSTLEDYEPIITDDEETNGKIITMTKSGIVAKYIIDENLNITETEEITGAQLTYEVKSRDGENLQVEVIVTDNENGLKTIEFDDGHVQEANGLKSVSRDCTIQLGVEYKVKITSKNGEVKTETILINEYYHTITKNLDEGISIDNKAIKTAYNQPYTATVTAGEEYILDTITVTMGEETVPVDVTTSVINIEKVTGDIVITATARKLEIQTTTPIIGTATTATISVSDYSQIRGTTLYINFTATIEGENCWIVNKEDNKTVPYLITRNGKYYFIATGTYDGKTITKEIEVVVNKYVSAAGLVQYDAGEWTKEEIEELEKDSLYSLYRAEYKFGGFTYKGSSSEGQSGIVTSRNQSADCEGWGFGDTPYYEGWQVLECENINGKTYVTKLVHAGAPEVFGGPDDLYGGREEYLLSSGTRNTGYNKFTDGTEIIPRMWDMYKDKELDAKGYIEDVHIMTLEEAEALETDELRKTGAAYFLATASTEWGLCIVIGNTGELRSSGTHNYSYYFGVRPVVSLKSGVYIASGTGTELDPYVLAKDGE